MPISVASRRKIAGVAAPLRELVRTTLALEGLRAGEIGILLTDDGSLRVLNRNWRGIDRATDVLSFSYSESAASGRGKGTARDPLGSAILAPPRCSQRAPAPASARFESPAAALAPTGRRVPVSGDLVISIDRSEAQARRYRQSAGRELARLVIHGALHLCGHDHHRVGEQTRMRAVERAALRASRATIGRLDAALRGTGTGAGRLKR